jgi:hypothetical protein
VVVLVAARTKATDSYAVLRIHKNRVGRENERTMKTFILESQRSDIRNQRSVLVLFALCASAFWQPAPKAFGVSPAPDGCYPNFTTAEGCQALDSLTTGAGNTGLGWRSLFSDSTGNFNTGVGVGALVLNNADSNTAVGAAALLLNTSGTQNTAIGTDALAFNDGGDFNTAVGYFALFSNNEGEQNTAVGWQALANGTGNLNFGNTAMGCSALASNTSGQGNTATGRGALFSNVDGENNTAVGTAALNQNTSGSSNIAIGVGAGQNLTTGDRNIDIGNTGIAGETNKIRIGTQGTQTGTFIAGISGTPVTGVAVLASNNGQLGVAASSQRFKNEIKAMDTASEAILGLKPVTFRYKKEIDPAGMPQFGLVAEEVEKINPDLVTRDAEGNPYSVRYEQVNAMLLNEFRKEHRAFVEEQRKVKKLESTVAGLIATVKEQAAQIERVNAHLQLSQTKRQLAARKP